MGKWEYMFVTLMRIEDGRWVVDTVNGEPLASRYVAAFEFFSAKGQERWEALNWHGGMAEATYPLFVFKRPVVEMADQPQLQVAGIKATPVFSLDTTY